MSQKFKETNSRQKEIRSFSTHIKFSEEKRNNSFEQNDNELPSLNQRHSSNIFLENRNYKK